MLNDLSIKTSYNNYNGPMSLETAIRGLHLVSGAVAQRGRGEESGYSGLSTTHGHITDCKLDSVVYADVCVVI